MDPVQRRKVDKGAKQKQGEMGLNGGKIQTCVVITISENRLN